MPQCNASRMDSWKHFAFLTSKDVHIGCKDWWIWSARSVKAFHNVETSLKKMHIIEAVLAILANCMLASLGSKKQSNTITNEQPYIALLTRLRKSLPCCGFLSLPSCIVHVCTRLMHAYKKVKVPAQHDEWCEYMTWHIMASNDQSIKSQRFVWPTSKGRSLYDWDPFGQVPYLVCGILCIYMN